MKLTKDTFLDYANEQLREMKSESSPDKKEARRASLDKAVAVAKASLSVDEFEIDEFKVDAPPAAEVTKGDDDSFFPDDFNDPDYLKGVPKKPKW